MFLILTIIICIISIYLFHNTEFDLLNTIGMIGSITSTIILSISIGTLIIFNIDARATNMSNFERQKALEYKIQSPNVRDEFGLLNKEIVDEIQKWNEDVVFYQTMKKDFWFGIFVPNIYDDLHTIDYEEKPTIKNKRGDTIILNANP